MEHPAYTLSALNLIGGAIAFSRKGSVPSLAAGLTLSATYLSAGYLLQKNADWGLELALGSSVVLSVAGLVRTLKTEFKKPVPMSILGVGLLSSSYYLYKYNEFYPLF
ncbi:uncharacterized protein KQ657_004921 [Scheffersomyces spartinae]|uniref:TMEM14-domain-containing protein n=1 Tax=Scheffersomyces spartinae TaxID=45513 RepID=A0A9P7VA78_9ASCO|nr:uncharacterized protein KQ657_004921 [Scheffersomyces spartinae]KAG7194209.1 hypothetical protein KQ657_004921 [Scheffersomyces spartinae]